MSQAKFIGLKEARAVVRGDSEARANAQRSWSKLRATVKAAKAFRTAGREVATNRITESQSSREALLKNDSQESVEVEGEDRERIGDLALLKMRIVESPIKSVMMLAVPLGIWGPSYFPAWVVFWINFAALIPLSSFLGQSTEDISSYTNEVIAGLLNATFGNVVEMMVVFMALTQGQIGVVQATLLGSILSNLLFVLGSCFVYGGLQQRELKFSSKAATTCASLLLLASISLVLPTFLSARYPDENFLQVSRYAAIILFFVYGLFLYFQLVTHKDYFSGEEEEDDEDRWSPCFSVFMLALTSLITAVSSDALVASIQGYSDGMALNKDFIGLILVASVGNVPEFYVTLQVAYKNKLDLALTIAVGSSCQMALMVTPFSVLVGWLLDKEMSLDFHPLQILSLILSVLVVSTVIQGGTATWLQGSLLVASYVIIAMIFYFLPMGSD